MIETPPNPASDPSEATAPEVPVPEIPEPEEPIAEERIAEAQTAESRAAESRSDEAQIAESRRDEAQAVRDIAEVPAVEIISSAALHLMSAAAVKCGLAEDTAAERAADLQDLDEARKLITALAGLVTAGSTEIGDHHARPLRDGLRSLQLAFREASAVPDAPGQGPGEKFTGPVR